MPAGMETLGEAAAVTVGAGLVDDAARAAALAAGVAGGEHPHGRLAAGLHHAAAVALGADLRRGAGGAAAALTGGALLHALHRQLLFAAEGGLRKAQRYADPDALTPLGAVAALLLAAEATAEEAAEDVP